MAFRIQGVSAWGKRRVAMFALAVVFSVSLGLMLWERGHALNALAQIGNGASAIDLVGQYDDSTSAPSPVYTKGDANNGANQFGFDNIPGNNYTADGVIDTTNHRFFIPDSENARILVYNLDSSNNLIDRIPDNVLGQPNLYTNAPSGTQTGLWVQVGGLAFDSANQRLFVADFSNNRVMVFDVATITNGEAAVNVLGESSFSSAVGSVTQSTFFGPTGVSYDSANTRLFVTDYVNNRTLVFNVSSITNGQNAVNVLGQALFTTSTAATTQAGENGPSGVSYDSANQRLFVAEFSNDRVVSYSVASVTNGKAAANVLGQTLFTTSAAATTQAGLNHPIGLAYDSANTRLFIGDRNNDRVIVQSVASIANGQNALNVLGQTLFTTSAAATTQAGLSFPNGLTYDSGNSRLYVFDFSNHRVIIHSVASITNGQNAANELGEFDDNLTTPAPVYTKGGVNNGPNAFGYNDARATALDTVHHRLFSADRGNRRVLVYNLDTSNNLLDHIPDNVLGQADFHTATSATTQSGMTLPVGVAYDGTNNRLFVAEGNRVLVFNVASISNGQNAANVLGQSLFTGATAATTQAGLNVPNGLAYDAAHTRLFVADTTNNRVIVYSTASISNGQNAANVLGQSLFTTAAAATTQAGLNAPVGVAYDSGNNRLFVADTTNNRVVAYNVASISNGQNAANVLGQATFTTATAATTQAGLSGPAGVAYDTANNRLFVGETTNRRALVYALSSITDGQNALNVLGQATFTTSTASVAQTGMSTPGHVTYDSANTRLWISDQGSNRVVAYDVALDTTPPAVSFTNPTSSADIAAGSSVTVTLTATDGTPQIALTLTVPCGTVTSANPVSIGSGASTSFVWDASACSNGLKTLSAVGVDAIGNTSAAVTQGITIDQTHTAVDLVGQYDDSLSSPAPVYTKTSANNVPNKLGMNNPIGTAYDTVNHRLFVADNSNNRVLVYNLDASDNLLDRIPDNVLGQPDFHTITTGRTQSGLNSPQAVAFDSANNRLFVADGNNARVLAFPTSSISNGENAANVLGQATFTTGTLSNSQAGMNFPTGLAYDTANNRLFVGEQNSNRVLVFNTASITDGMGAAHVLGQTLFTTATGATSQAGLNLPRGVAYDSANQRLFVAQSGANRVSVFNVSSIIDGQNAANVLGQTLFTTSTAATSQAGLNSPVGVAYDSANSRLFVAESASRRVVAYGVSSITNGQNAANVLGQALFTTSTAATTQTGLNGPSGIAFDSANQRLAIADQTNHRVIIHNTTSLADNQNAADALGQSDDSLSAPAPIFTRGTTNNTPNILGVSFPHGAAFDGVHHRLFVVDSSNNRVLEYDLDGNDALLDHIPDRVLGQADFHTGTAAVTQVGMSGPQDAVYDGVHDRLFVIQSTAQRITVYDTSSIANGQNAANVLGQSLFTTSTGATTQAGLNGPVSAGYDSANQLLYVAQATANRVSVFDVSSISDGQNAINVLGQSTFTTSTAATTQAGMNVPRGVAYDSANHRIFVVQSTGNRVTTYDVSAISDGENATNVLGQSSFTTSAAAQTQAGLNSPQGVAYDSAGSRLFVVQGTGNRVSVFPTASLSDGENAQSVLGPANFTSSTGGTSQTRLLQPAGVAFDPVSNRLLVADSSNSRLMFFPFPTPLIPSSAVTADANTNGKIDRVVVTFNQDLDGSTVSGSDFTVTSPSYAVASASETSAGVVTIVLTEAGAADTDATPTVNVVGSISDAANLQTISSGSVLSTDGAAPVVMSVSPADGSTNISRSTDLALTFSEPMTTTFAEGTQFSVSPDPGAFSSVFSGGNKIVTITPTTPFAANTLETVTTAEGQITAAGGSPNGLLTTGPSTGDWSFTTAADVTMSSAVTSDTNTNGKIDHVVVSFNQDLDGATVTGSDFSVTSPSYTIASASETSAGIVTIVLNEGGSADTDAAPTVTIVGSVSNAADTATATSGSVLSTDGAAPVVISVSPANATTGVSTVADLVLTFSEPITTTFNEGTQFAVSPDPGAFTSAFSGGNKIVTLSHASPFSAGSLITVTTDETQITAAGGSPNGLLTTGPSSGDWSFTTAAGLTMSSAVTADANANGKIDRLAVTFSEDLDGSTVSGSDFTVTSPSYAVASASETSPGVVTLVLNEAGSADTDATPTVNVVGSIANAAHTATITSGSVLSTDGAAPVVMSVSPADGSTDVNKTSDLVLTFSEPMTTTFVEGTQFAVSPDPGSFTTAFSGGNKIVTVSHASPFAAASLITVTTDETQITAAGGSPNTLLTTGPSTGDWSFTTAADVTMTSAATADANTNGKIDRVVVTFNQDLDGTTVSGADFTVTSPSYTVASASETSPGVVTIVLNEGGSADTDATPTVTIVGSVSNAADTSTATSGSVLSTDGAAPVVMSVSPANATTGVDATSDLVLTFSEPMNATFDEGTQFAVSPDPGSFTTTFSGGNKIVTLSHAIPFAGNSLISVTTDETHITAAGGSPNQLVTTGPSSGDWSFTTAANVTMTSAVTADNDTNGKIDRLAVTFSEDLDGSTVSGADFTVTSPSYTVASASESSPGVVTIVLNEGGSADTDATPTVTVVGSISNANHTATITSGSVLSADGAAPVVMSVVPADGSTDVNATTDLVLTFSEPMTATFDEGTQFAVSPDPGSFTSAFSGNGKVVTLSPASPFSSETLITVTTDEAQVTAAGGSPNHLVTTGPSTGDWSFTTAANVTMSSAVTADTNTNGKIDRVVVTFNADLDGSTVSGSDFSVTSPSYSVSSASETSPGTVTILLNEGGSADTGATPTVNIVGSVSNATDSAAATSGSVFADDGAAPVVMSVSPADGSTDVDKTSALVLTFSEPMTTTFDEGTQFSVSPDPGSFTTAFSSGNRIVTLSHASPFAANSLISVTTNQGAITAAGGSPDQLVTTGPSTGDWSFTTATDLTLDAAVTSDANTNGKIDHIRVAFSEDVDGATVSASDFTVTSNSYAVLSASRTAAGIVTLVLMPGGSADTDATPTVNVVGSISNSAHTKTITSGSVVAADGAAPVVMTVTPADGSTGVDRANDLVLTFSEPMTTTFSEGAQFTVSPDPGSFTTAFSGGNKIVTLSHAALFAGTSLITVTTDETQITAASGMPNQLLTTGPVSGDWSFTTAADFALTSAVTGDEDANGKIDRIVVTFNQDADGSTVSGSDFTVTNPSYGVASASETSAGVVTIVLDEGGSADTGAVPTVNVVGPISNAADTDTIGPGSVVALDGAAPVVMSVSPADGATDVSPATDLVLTFSEPMDTSFDEGTQFSVSPDPGSFMTQFSANDTVATLSHAALFPDTTLVSVTTDETQISAAAGNPDALLTTGPATGDWSFTTGTHLSMDSATTADMNANGKIDRLAVHFSEDLDGATVSASDFTVTSPSYAVSSASETSPGVVTLVLAESGSHDTGATPMVNLVGSVSNAAHTKAVSSTSVLAEDGALPVLLSAVTRDGDSNGKLDAIVATFSEDLDGTSVDAADFSVASPSRTVVSAMETSAGVVTVGFAESGSPDTAVTPTLFLDSSVADLAANAQPSGSVVATDAAPAVLVSAAAADTDADQKTDRIVATFSEDLNGATVSSGDFTVTSPMFTVASAAETSAGVVTLILAEHASCDANATPTVNVVGSVADLPGNTTTSGSASANAAGSCPSGGGGGSNVPPTVTPSVQVASPNGGERLTPGTHFNVTWSTVGRVDLVNVAYSVDAGAHWNPIALGIVNTGSVLWTVPDVQTTRLRVRVQGTDLATVYAQDVSDADATILGSVPAATFVPPPPLRCPVGTDLSPGDGDPAAACVEEGQPYSRTNPGTTLAPGMYVRTVGDTTVYVILPDGSRSAVLDARTYFTWEPSFGTVVYVTPSVLQIVDQAQPLLPKPNVVLATFWSDPAVYALVETPGEPGTPLLRRLDSEAVAAAIYGPNWKDFVLDYNAGFRTLFAIGAPVMGAESLRTDLLQTRDSLSQKAGLITIESVRSLPNVLANFFSRVADLVKRIL